MIGPVKKGALHKEMGIPEDKPIATGRLEAMKKRVQDETTRKRIQFALNARKWNHGG